MTSQFNYVIGGVRVSSPLPAALPGSGFFDAELQLRLASVGPTSADGYSMLPGYGCSRAWLSPDGSRGVLALPTVDDLESINEEASAVAIRHIAPFAAARQGVLTLHAACVTRENRCLAFVGASGTGKSTLRKALQDLGADAVSDDLLPVRNIGPKWFVPAHGTGPLIPLDALVFPMRSPRQSRSELQRLSPRETMTLLLKHGFGELRDADVWKSQFSAYASIANSVAGVSALYPDGMDWLASNLSSLWAGIIKQLP